MFSEALFTKILIWVTYFYCLGFCGGQLKWYENNIGRLRSVDADKDGFYEPNLNCTWTLRRGRYGLLHLNVTEIDIQPDDACGKDFLKVQSLHINTLITSFLKFTLYSSVFDFVHICYCKK